MSFSPEMPIKLEKDNEFKVYQRTKKGPVKVTGRLKTSGIEISITAKPDDWKVLKSYCVNRWNGDLYKDLTPFVDQALLKAMPRKTVSVRQGFIDIMKVQAGLLHGFLSHVSKRKAILNNLPSLQAIKLSEDEKPIQNDLIVYTQILIGKIFQNYINHYKMQKIIDGDRDNFRVTYIDGGKKILKEDSEKSTWAVRSLNSVLNSKKEGIINGAVTIPGRLSFKSYEHDSIKKHIYKFFQILILSISIPFYQQPSGPFNKEHPLDALAVRLNTSSSELLLMHNIIKDIFPSLKA